MHRNDTFAWVSCWAFYCNHWLMVQLRVRNSFPIYLSFVPERKKTEREKKRNRTRVYNPKKENIFGHSTTLRIRLPGVLSCLSLKALTRSCAPSLAFNTWHFPDHRLNNDEQILLRHVKRPLWLGLPITFRPPLPLLLPFPRYHRSPTSPAGAFTSNPPGIPPLPAQPAPALAASNSRKSW